MISLYLVRENLDIKRKLLKMNKSKIFQKIDKKFTLFDTFVDVYNNIKIVTI